MIRHLTAVRRDLLEGTEEVFIDGPAICRGNTVSAKECPPFAGTDTLERTADAVILSHRGETESRIVLPLAGTGEAEVSSMFGTMRFGSEITEYVWEEEEIRLRYRLFQEGNTVSEIELVFRFRTEKRHTLPA